MKPLYFFCILQLACGCSDKPRLSEPATLAEETPSFSIVAENNNAPADNYSYTTIRVKNVNRGNFDPEKGITFTSSLGVFVGGNNTVKAGFGTDSVATVLLKSAEEGVAQITALVGADYVVKTDVFFTKALPTIIQVEPDSSVLSPVVNRLTKVTARLLRYPGTASTNQLVLFSDSIPGGGSAGIFVNITRSDANGIAAATYRLQDTSFHGFVYIKCSVQTGGPEVSGRNRIRIF